MTFKIEEWLRPSIASLKPYSSARDEYSGDAMTFLDANENPYETDLNRYPDPKQSQLKDSISKMLGIRSEQLFLGNGSDEAIDLLIRASCEAGRDRIIAISPSYGMYQVCADIQGIEVDKVLLNQDFSLSSERIIDKLCSEHKLIFLCSPNNPTGNLLGTDSVAQILDAFSGIVVVDEAYIDFSDSASFIDLIDKYPNLVVLRTFSKAWGLAGARCGMAIANEQVIKSLSNIKYPYNLNALTQLAVLKALSNQEEKDIQLSKIKKQRQALLKAVTNIAGVLKVFNSEANFVLVKVEDPITIYKELLSEGIVVRNRDGQDLCKGCLRLTVGTELENSRLIETLQKLLS